MQVVGFNYCTNFADFFTSWNSLILTLKCLLHNYIIFQLNEYKLSYYCFNYWRCWNQDPSVRLSSCSLKKKLVALSAVSWTHIHTHARTHTCAHTCTHIGCISCSFTLVVKWILHIFVAWRSMWLIVNWRSMWLIPYCVHLGTFKV